MNQQTCTCCRHMEVGSERRKNFFNEHFIPRKWELHYYSEFSKGVQLVLNGYCRDCYQDLEEPIPIPQTATENELLKSIYDAMQSAHPYDKFEEAIGYYGACKARSVFYQARNNQTQYERNKVFLDLFHDYDRAQARYWLEQNFPSQSRAEVLRDTAGDLFCNVVRRAEDAGDLDKVKGILDYIIPNANEGSSREGVKLTSYEFDFVPIVNFGGSEGIYIDCLLKGKFDESGRYSISIGTLKTLETGLDACKAMGELCGALMFHADKYVSENIQRYTPDKYLTEREG